LQLDGLRADDDFVMHLKVILVGQKGAGKTALAMRFCKNTFEESYKATLGVDFLTKRYYAFGVPCEVNVWDTAGEERFQAVSRAYYRGAGAAIVCFDLNDRASFDKVSRWMTDVHREDESVQMFLVGTKSDLYNEVGNDEPSAFARSHRMEYIETSAKDGRNVKALFDRIVTVHMDKFLSALGHDTEDVVNITHHKMSASISLAREPTPGKPHEKSCMCAKM
jgi:small GTP-binding protein